MVLWAYFIVSRIDIVSMAFVSILCVYPTLWRPVKTLVLLIEEAQSRMYVCISIIKFRICSESGDTAITFEYIDVV